MENRYKEFLGSYVFVFQYKSADKKGGVELEDMLPVSFLNSILDKVVKDIGDGRPPMRKRKFCKTKTFADVMVDNEIAAEAAWGDDSGFKPLFKNKFNEGVRDFIGKLDALEKFEAKLPDYAQWSSEVVRQLQCRHGEYVDR